jgi:serine/threonine-protein kinase
VLYEMLTGEPPYTGSTPQAVLGKIVLAAPASAMEERRSVPQNVDAAIRKALEKVPADRFGSAEEFADVLSGRLRLPVSVHSHFRRPGSSLSRTLRWSTIPLVVFGAFLVGTRWSPTGAPDNAIAAVRLVIPVPAGFSTGQQTNVAVSPDGSAVVFAAADRLILRRLDSFEADTLEGTGGDTPFFSPDGAWLGFVRGGTIMRQPLDGGLAERVLSGGFWGFPAGVTWGTSGIVYSQMDGGLWVVPADGGEPRQLTAVRESEGESSHTWPDVLPDGAILFTVLGPSGHAPDARLVLADPSGLEWTTLLEGVTYGRYVAGHLLYADHEGTVFLRAFDLGSRRFSAPGRPVLSGARVSFWGGGVGLAVSRNGTLAYATGTELAGGFIARIDRAGRELSRFTTPTGIGMRPSVSPDGLTLALPLRSSRNDDIWLMDLGSGRFDRFTFESPEDETPVWSADGRQIAYRSAWTGNRQRIYIKAVGTSEPARIVRTLEGHIHLTSWSPDGQWLAAADRGASVSLLSVQDTALAVPIGPPGASTSGAVFSPDGQWLAYQSDESGRPEVYVIPLAEPGSAQQVSREGGTQPRWSRDDEELFFRQDARLMSARRVSTGAVAWAEPVPLAVVGGSWFDWFGVVPATGDFLVQLPNPEAPAREIFVVHNWLDEVLRD